MAGDLQIKWAMHVLHYLKGTANLGLMIDGNKPLELTMYSDSDWGGDEESSRSTT